MNLFYEAEQILRREEYYTLVTTPDEAFDFEDETLFGFVKIYLDPGEIASDWEKQQDSFLTKNARRIRANLPKSWNAYSVFLSPGAPSPDVRIALSQIEDDFRGTRKIARSSLTTLEDLQRALYPLIGLVNRVKLERAGGSNLRERLTSLRPIEVELLLKGGAREVAAAAQLEDT
jgi:hypothetical protein